MKSKVSKKGVLLLIVSLAIIAVLFIPPQPTTLTQPEIVSTDQAIIDVVFSDDVNFSQDDQDIVDQVFLTSVVNTDIVFTESDNTLIQNFLDEQNIDSPLSTEKFGIETQVAIVSPDGTVDTLSDFFGVSQLSVFDSDGNARDLDTIQISMQGVTKDNEKSTNIWGQVDFYLDDDIVDSKYIWSSETFTQKSTMSFVDTLTFDYKPDLDLIIEIGVQEAVITNLQNEIERLSKNQSNTGRFIPDPTIPPLREQLNVEISKLNALNALHSSEVEKAYPPSFSDQEKTNHTFTLSDEGRDWLDQSEHTYRVVLNELHATVDSDNDFKEFHWTGQNIVYELKVKVDGRKNTILNDQNNAITIFKSDNNFSYVVDNAFDVGKTLHGGWQHLTYIEPVQHHNIKVYVDNELKLSINGNTPSSGFTFPRNSDLKITVDGVVVFNEKTPRSQVNHQLRLSTNVDELFVKYGSCHSSGGSAVFAYELLSGVSWSTITSSSFGYSDNEKEPSFGATASQSPPSCGIRR